MNLLLINFEKNCDRSKIKAKLSAAASTTIETGVFTLHQHSFSCKSIVAIFSSFPIMPCRPSNAIQIDGRSLELIDGKRGQSAWTKLIGKSRIGEMCQTICWKDLPQISKWRNKRFQQIWSYEAVDWFWKIMWQKNTCIRQMNHISAWPKVLRSRSKAPPYVNFGWNILAGDDGNIVFFSLGFSSRLMTWMNTWLGFDFSSSPINDCDDHQPWWRGFDKRSGYLGLQLNIW